MIKQLIRYKLLKGAVSLVVSYLSRKSTQKAVGRMAKNILRRAVSAIETRATAPVSKAVSSKKRRVKHA